MMNDGEPAIQASSTFTSRERFNSRSRSRSRSSSASSGHSLHVTDTIIEVQHEQTGEGQKDEKNKEAYAMYCAQLYAKYHQRILEMEQGVVYAYVEEDGEILGVDDNSMGATGSSKSSSALNATSSGAASQPPPGSVFSEICDKINQIVSIAAQGTSEITQADTSGLLYYLLLSLNQTFLHTREFPFMEETKFPQPDDDAQPYIEACLLPVTPFGFPLVSPLPHPRADVDAQDFPGSAKTFVIKLPACTPWYPIVERAKVLKGLAFGSLAVAPMSSKECLVAFSTYADAQNALQSINEEPSLRKALGLSQSVTAAEPPLGSGEAAANGDETMPLIDRRPKTEMDIDQSQEKESVEHDAKPDGRDPKTTDDVPIDDEPATDVARSSFQMDISEEDQGMAGARDQRDGSKMDGQDGKVGADTSSMPGSFSFCAFGEDAASSGTVRAEKETPKPTFAQWFGWSSLTPKCWLQRVSQLHTAFEDLARLSHRSFLVSCVDDWRSSETAEAYIDPGKLQGRDLDDSIFRVQRWIDYSRSSLADCPQATDKAAWANLLSLCCPELKKIRGTAKDRYDFALSAILPRLHLAPPREKGNAIRPPRRSAHSFRSGTRQPVASFAPLRGRPRQPPPVFLPHRLTPFVVPALSAPPLGIPIAQLFSQGALPVPAVRPVQPTTTINRPAPARAQPFRGKRLAPLPLAEVVRHRKGEADRRRPRPAPQPEQSWQGRGPQQAEPVRLTKGETNRRRPRPAPQPEQTWQGRGPQQTPARSRERRETDLRNEKPRSRSRGRDEKPSYQKPKSLSRERSRYDRYSKEDSGKAYRSSNAEDRYKSSKDDREDSRKRHGDDRDDSPKSKRYHR